MSDYKADFLWPHDNESVEEAAYEFVNAKTEEYRKEWYDILIERAKRITVEPVIGLLDNFIEEVNTQKVYLNKTDDLPKHYVTGKIAGLDTAVLILKELCSER